MQCSICQYPTQFPAAAAITEDQKGFQSLGTRKFRDEITPDIDGSFRLAWLKAN